MNGNVLDEKFRCGCGGEKPNKRPTNTEASVIEEIERLDIDEYTKESILRRLKRDASRENEMANELCRCYSEIGRLEKAIIFLSKEIGKCKENHNRI